MGFKKIAVVCEGKEIDYGLNFLHLFQYKSDGEEFHSVQSQGLSIEIYSSAVFGHTDIADQTIKIFVGNARKTDSSYTKLFDRFGMTIYQRKSDYILQADDKQLTGPVYEEFLLYANEKRNEYLHQEKEYAERAEALNANWIAKEFKQEASGGLFRGKKRKLLQQYECLAFVLYLDYIKSEGRSTEGL